MDQESSESEADERLNGDGNKQILAPAEGPRENLISTAVKFLQNPKVMSSPLYQKKAFLEKKGLTQEEINIAVQRSGVKETTSTDVVPRQAGPPPGYQPGAVVAGPQTQFVPMPPQSGWARARDLTMTTVIVASVSYAVYQLFQKYLRPFLFGKSLQEKRLERLEQQIAEIQKSVTESLSEMTRTLATIQTSLNNQQSQVLLGQGESRGITDLKADIASLKGLLLNRSQFPPAPATSPILPSWQRTPASTSGPALTTAAATSSSYADVLKTSVASSHTDSHPSTQHQAIDGDLPNHADNLDPGSDNSADFEPEVQDAAENGMKDDQGLSLNDKIDLESAFVGGTT